MFQVNFEGLSGHVVFDTNGVRQNFSLGVYEVSLDFGPSKVSKYVESTVNLSQRKFDYYNAISFLFDVAFF